MFDNLLSSVIPIAKAAGDAILPFFQSKSLNVSRKTDNTPVTGADITAHSIIESALTQLNDWPILSEEGEIPSFEVRKLWSPFWIIDPLDGTRGFIHGLEEFTVNIAVIENHRPVLGVLYVPVQKTLFYAAKGTGAFRIVGEGTPQRIQVADRSFDQLRFVVGRYHKINRIQPVLDAIPHSELLRLNSSLKFVLIAQGDADVYARFGPINEWDTAAGQCILEEAGGKVVDFKGKSLQYNAKKSLLCPPLLAVGKSEYIDALFKFFK